MIQSSSLIVDFVKFKFVKTLLNSVTFGVKLVGIILSWPYIYVSDYLAFHCTTLHILFIKQTLNVSDSTLHMIFHSSSLFGYTESMPEGKIYVWMWQNLENFARLHIHESSQSIARCDQWRPQAWGDANISPH
jgi:hypothetical protein